MGRFQVLNANAKVPRLNKTVNDRGKDGQFGPDSDEASIPESLEASETDKAMVRSIDTGDLSDQPMANTDRLRSNEVDSHKSRILPHGQDQAGDDDSDDAWQTEKSSDEQETETNAGQEVEAVADEKADEEDGGDDSTMDTIEQEQEQQEDEEDAEDAVNAQEASHGSTRSSTPVSPVKDYFDVIYNKRRRRYVTVPKTTEFPVWEDLAMVPICRLKQRPISVGTCVNVCMQGSDDEAAYAKVKAIRVLAKSRWLLLLAWLHDDEDVWHESNHLQILLWDTVGEILRPNQIVVRTNMLYDACCTRRLLSRPEELRKWQMREEKLHAEIPR